MAHPIPTSSESPSKNSTSIANVLGGEARDEGPEANWEVAYVYAFLVKFTELQDFTSTTTLLLSPTSLELALLSSSPSPSLLSPLSPLSDCDVLPPSPSPPAPDPSPLLVQIIETFQANFPVDPDRHVRKDWVGWVVRWVNKRLLEEGKGGLRWERNLMKKVGLKSGSEQEDRFWALAWEEKAHLLRVLVDWQLTYSPDVRAMIEKHYDLGKQRVIKRDPSINPLSILPVGKVGKRELWHLDSSGRLYASYNPFKPKAPWHVLTTSTEGYEAYMQSLAEPSEEEKELAGPFKKARIAARKRANKVPVEKEVAQEMAARIKLESDLVGVLARDDALEALEVKKARVAERAALRADKATRRTLQTYAYEPSSSRGTRLRTQTRRVDYVYDGGAGGSEEEEEEEDWEGEEDGEDGEGVGRRSAPVVQEWKGERRSSRIQLKDGSVDDEMGVDDVAQQEEDLVLVGEGGEVAVGGGEEMATSTSVEGSSFEGAVSSASVSEEEVEKKVVVAEEKVVDEVVEMEVDEGVVV